MNVYFNQSFWDDYNNGCTSRLSPNKKAIIIGVCKGNTQESMGYTVDCMIKTLSELGINIINTIKYFDTKNFPVANNETIKEKIDELLTFGWEPCSEN